MTAAITIQGLVKDYGAKRAVDHLDLTVPDGSFYGLLGPNGAGKTTTIGAITGLVRPTAGTIQVHGHDAWAQAAAARRHLGVCAQEPNFDDFLGLERILAYHAGYFGMPYAKGLERARELLRFFDLYDYRDKRTSTLSGGMKRRLLLARAMMHEPRVLILDEPTAGVDVEIRRTLWDTVQRLNQEQGITVLLTTHYLEEAERLCDEVTVIDHGRAIERGSPDALRDKYGVRRVAVVAADLPDDFDAGDLGFAPDARGRLVYEAADATDKVPELMRRIEAAGGQVADMEVQKTRLEDVFVELTRRDRHTDAAGGTAPGSGVAPAEADP